jgi:hypothetical protein
MRQTRNGRNKATDRQKEQDIIAAGVVGGVDYVAKRRQSSSSNYVEPVVDGMRMLNVPFTGNVMDDNTAWHRYIGLGYEGKRTSDGFVFTIPQAGFEAQVADQHRQYLNKDNFRTEAEIMERTTKGSAMGEVSNDVGFEEIQASIEDVLGAE